MLFDVVVPLIIFLCASIALGLFLKYEKKFNSVTEGKRQFSRRDAVSIVLVICFAATAVALIPENLLIFCFLLYFAIVLFILAHVFTDNWRVSILAPTVFIVLYLFYWNPFIMNLFSIFIVVVVTSLLGSFFTQETETEAKSILNREKISKAMLLFAVLIVLVDLILVWGTNIMEIAARKVIELQLPMLVIIPMFPFFHGYNVLGLGDIFLSGLLGIMTAQKMGARFGMLSISLISTTVFLGETVLLNYYDQPFPCTVLIVSGWLMALGIKRLHLLKDLCQDVHKRS
ncbi:MAG: hypothetical protein QXH91_00225 [Candidatus Bathyarchaeia archaeon]